MCLGAFNGQKGFLLVGRGNHVHIYSSLFSTLYALRLYFLSIRAGLGLSHVNAIHLVMRSRRKQGSSELWWMAKSRRQIAGGR
jgi:hypothetical protein